MRANSVWIALVGLTSVAIGLVWFTDLPLGVPGEWEWSRAPATTPLALTFATLAIAAVGYLGFVWLGARRVDRSGTRERLLWLAGLWLAGFVWIWMAQEAAPEGYQLSKTVWVLYFRGPSGYFAEARDDNRPLAVFLEDYERRVREGDVLHIGTHPPGLILVFRALLTLARASPELSDAVLATEPESVRSSFEALRQTNPANSLPLQRAEEAALWLAALLALALAALTVCPLYGLLRCRHSAKASWLATAFWPAVPAVAVFLPKSDAWFGCLTALVLWLWSTGVNRDSRLRCTMAGLTLWLGMLFSLAFLAVGFLAAVGTFWNRRWPYHSHSSRTEVAPRGEGRGAKGEGQNHSLPSYAAIVPADSSLRTLGWCVVRAALGFGIPSLILRLWGGINLISVWWINLGNHAGFYREYPRTYWKWLLVNPIEFAVAAGIPLAALAIAAMIRQWRALGPSACGPPVALLATWGLLWLSGKTMGESARLWLLLVPGLIWAVGPAFEADDSLPSTDSSGDRAAIRRGLAALAVQLISCGALVSRIVGFHY
ncbi:MAG: hypothetical protein EXS05_22730 [Planctomycetaceae bacterium]|nr:hypothetical protein [Planctomycetaceae bacterium]